MVLTGYNSSINSLGLFGVLRRALKRRKRVMGDEDKNKIDEDRNKIVEVFEWIEERWFEILVFLFLIIAVGKCAIGAIE